jgi:flagellar biosynthesis/type III secretory pathway protein FliH
MDSDFEDDFGEQSYVTSKADVEKSYTKEQLAMIQAGYRDGAAKGQEKRLQDGFDDGFEVGSKIGKAIGRFMAHAMHHYKASSESDPRKVGMADAIKQWTKCLIHEGPTNKFSKESFESVAQLTAIFPEIVNSLFQEMSDTVQELTKQMVTSA